MKEVSLNKIPRLKAAHLSLKYPDLLDVRFIYSYNTQSNGGQIYIDYMMKTFGPPAEAEHMKNFNKFRYLLCFDGNNAPPYERPETIMISGSVPLYQTNYEKYWSFLLSDGINYIKINDDLSNLITVIKDLNANPERALKIAEEARKLAKEVLMPDFFESYLIEVINKVSYFQKIKIN
jgi:hypothetical protein